MVGHLNSYINSRNKSNHQSVHRKFHSTETALLKIHNDVLSSVDNGRDAASPLLDLSTVFATIDVSILLRRLDDWFRVTGKALDWFKLYLARARRCQRIKLGECLSSKADLPFGIPQGIVLGPLLFTLYTTPRSSMISVHTIPHHLHTDDGQLCFFCPSDNSAAAVNGLQSC